MDRRAFGERIKLFVGVTAIPAASVEDVMREAQAPANGRKARVATRAKWWWLRLLIGAVLLCLVSLVGGPIGITVILGFLGAILVLS
jgi:hypothetical protein